MMRENLIAFGIRIDAFRSPHEPAADTDILKQGMNDQTVDVTAMIIPECSDGSHQLAAHHGLEKNHIQKVDFKFIQGLSKRRQMEITVDFRFASIRHFLE